MTPFEQAIAALGNTPEQVTAVLRAKGIKGYRCSAGRCPVANYLKSCGFPQVTVATSAKCYRDERCESQVEESVQLNAGVRNWIIGFDDGAFPEFYQQDVGGSYTQLTKP